MLEGLSGRGAHWGEAPGFQGGLAALRDLPNIAFLAGPGPPAPPQMRHMSRYLRRKRRLTTRPSPPEWELFRACKLGEGGRGSCFLATAPGGASAGSQSQISGRRGPSLLERWGQNGCPPPVEDAGSHRAATHLRAGGMVAGEARNGEAGRVAAERLGDPRRPILGARGISRTALVILRQAAADFRAELVAVGALRRAVQVAVNELA